MKKLICALLTVLLIVSLCGFTGSSASSSKLSEGNAKGFSSSGTKAPEKAAKDTSYTGNTYYGKNNKYSITIPSSLGTMTKDSYADSTGEAMMFVSNNDEVAVMVFRLDLGWLFDTSFFSLDDFAQLVNDMLLEEYTDELKLSKPVKIEHPNAKDACQVSMKLKESGEELDIVITYISTKDSFYMVFTGASKPKYNDALAQIPYSLKEA